jgi:adenosylcobinamide-GDP ribazoletransferase
MSGSWHDQPWPRAFFTAVQFLSRIPVPGGATRDLSTFSDDIRRGLQFFPLIGAIIGLITAAALYLFSLVLPFHVAVIAALAVEALVTGAFHEDAVADFFDAFGGGWTREDVLRILKDSRVGSFGALGLILAVALRAGGLIDLGTAASAGFALIVSGAVGRQLILAIMSLVPPVPAREGLSKDVGQVADWATFARGFLFASPIFAFAVWRDAASAAIIVAILALFALWFRALLLRRLGGVTGDCLGFSAYVGMIVTTLALARLS